MFTIEASVVIKQPPEAVFGYVADPANIPKWRPEVIAVDAAGPLRPGAEFSETFNFMGKKSARMRVLEYDTGRKLVIRALTGPMLRPTQTFTLKSATGGTEV